MPTFIYIGRLTEIDTVETDYDAENPNAVLGTYDRSVMKLTSVTGNDASGNGAINDNENGPVEAVTYDLGSGTVTTRSDHTGVYQAVVTESDGSTSTNDVLVVQMTNGDTFVTDLLNGGDLDNLNIRSIELVSAGPNDYSGWFPDQSVDNTTIVCFASGTLIRTVAGDVPVEDLSQGDQVMTLDNGFQPIRWIGRRHLSAAELARNPNLRPIRIRAGALGANCPERDLTVSPQHRMLLRSRIAERMCDAGEILVAAKHLLEVEGIEVAADVSSVTYHHFLLERHEVVLANEAEAESLFTGRQALKSLPRSARQEIFTLFPELLDIDHAPTPARTLIRGITGRKLAARHAKNGKALVGHWSR